MRRLMLAALALLAGCDVIWPEDQDPTPFRTAAGYEWGYGVVFDDPGLDRGVVGTELDLRIAEWQAARPGYEAVPYSMQYVVIDASSYKGSTGGWEPLVGGIYLCWRTAPPLAATGHELDHVVFGAGYGH